MKSFNLFICFLITYSSSLGQMTEEKAFYKLIDLMENSIVCKSMLGSSKYYDLLDYDYDLRKINFTTTNSIYVDGVVSMKSEIILDLENVDLNPDKKEEGFLNTSGGKYTARFWLKEPIVIEQIINNPDGQDTKRKNIIDELIFCFEKPLDVDRFNNALRILCEK